MVSLFKVGKIAWQHLLLTEREHVGTVSASPSQGVASIDGLDHTFILFVLIGGDHLCQHATQHISKSLPLSVFPFSHGASKPTRKMRVPSKRRARLAKMLLNVPCWSATIT